MLASEADRCNASEPVVEAPRLINGSNLTDMGRSSAWRAVGHGVHLRVGPADPGVEASGRAASAPGRGCRGIAGHRPRRSVDSERGKRPEVALPRSTASRVDGQARRRLMAAGRGGVAVVVVGVATHRGGRESRLQGEGRQQVRSGVIGKEGRR